MNKLINKYLNQHIIVHSKFYNKSKDLSLVGWKMVEDLVKIFNLSEEESVLLISKWLKRRKYKEFELEKFQLKKPIVETPINRERLPNRFAPPYEPKRSDRWVIIFPENYNLPSYCVRNTQRPIILSIINGIVNWGEILMVFNDPIGPSVSQAIMDLTYPPNLGVISYTLEMLDPVGVCVERWEISGIINRIEFGELSYSDSDITTVSLKILPNECRLLF